MTNFDFLFSIQKFSSFAGAACAAEKIFGIDTAACAVNARRAAELAVKWMYESDKALPEPERDQLAALTGAPEFRAVVGEEMLRALDFIRRVGNNAAHNQDSVTREQAEYALRNLYSFCRFLARRYAGKKIEDTYDKSLLDPDAELVTEAFDQGDIRRLLAENRAMKRLLRAKSGEKALSSAPATSEADTRRLRIEADLAYAGWRRGEDLLSEYPIDGLPGGSGVGYADYVLCDKEGVPLAIVETQASSRSLAIGRQQAKLYADALEKRFSRRPVIFLANGEETRIWQDSVAPERICHGFYAKQDLERCAAILAACRAIEEEDILAHAPDREYQRDALRAILSALCTERRRLAYLSMAPGSGKTRIAASAVAVLRRCGIVRTVLYLSHSEVLSAQAMRQFFDNGATRYSATLRDKGELSHADTVFATFAELLAEADDTMARGGSHFFTAGRFDLVICDETDSAAVARYRDVLSAFDAPLLAMTATPAEEIDPLLAAIVEAADTKAVFSYPYAQAIRDGYLAAFHGKALTLSHLQNGIREDALSAGDKDAYRSLFSKVGEAVPSAIRPEEMFTEFYCTDTVRTALRYFRDHAVTHDGVLGKTILFTESHAHSEMIYDEWGRLFPTDAPHTCRVIDGETNYVRTLIDEFTDPAGMPRVAVSHDLLLDGIDIPAVENIVFFTRVPSRALFWQMLGRGMRRCAALPGGKETFFVLDLWGNFARWYDEATDADAALPIWSQRFRAQLALHGALSAHAGNQKLAPLRRSLTDALLAQLRTLQNDHFRIRGYQAALQRLSTEDALTAPSVEDQSFLHDKIAPLILPDCAAHTAAFEAQFCALMLARLERAPAPDSTAALLRTVSRLSAIQNRPEIIRQKKLLNRILLSGYLVSADVPALDGIRRTLLPLLSLLPAIKPRRIRIADRILAEHSLREKHPTPTKGQIIP